MEKYQLKSLLENIYRALTEAEYSPHMTPEGPDGESIPWDYRPPLEVPDDLFGGDLPPPPDISPGPGLHWEWDAEHGGWTIHRDDGLGENLPPDEPEPTWGEWLQNPNLRDVPRMPWAPPYPYQG